MEKKDNIEKLDNLFKKYELSNEEINEIKIIILPIIDNKEFKLRSTSIYPHHGNITLGEHIMEDSIVTYILSKKYKLNNNYRIDLALEIAMFHDLYTIPWQNNKDAKVHKFFHKHGFRHPVEAVINAINWYPDYFKNSGDTKIIIDGILHHMYPLPVTSINEKNVYNSELKNLNYYEKLSKEQQKIIIDSLKRKKIGSISISKSKYIEGRIMAKADRKVSRKQIRDFQSMKSLITGHNKKIR